MLCVTGNETSVGAWLARVAACDQRAAAAGVGAPLHELRLDALDAVDDDTFAALGRHARRTVVCCRPTRQGGGFSGDEAARLALLGRAAEAGARWLDVEADVPAERIGVLAAGLAPHG